jgi:hypothetical protein
MVALLSRNSIRSCPYEDMRRTKADLLRAAKRHLVVALLFPVICMLQGCVACNNDFGFIDKSGKLVVDLDRYLDADYLNLAALVAPHPRSDRIAESVWDYSCGMAPISFHPDDRGGFLDGSGKLVGEFGAVGEFSEGLAAVITKGHSRDSRRSWGYVDSSCKLVIPASFDRAKEFSQGLAAVCIDEKWGYINKTGRVVIKPIFDEAEKFSEGLATVALHDKTGCIDRTGKFVLEPIFDEVYATSEGVTVARKTASQNASSRIDQSYFDEHGHLLFTKTINALQLKYMVMEHGCPSIKLGNNGFRDLGVRDNPSFSDGLAVLQVGPKYGYMDKSGSVVIAPQYDYAFPFSDGMAAVYQDDNGGRIAFIDKRGHQITPYNFTYALPFSEGFAVVRENEGWPYTCRFIDKTGKYVFDTYSWARSFKEGKANIGLPTTYL